MKKGQKKTETLLKGFVIGLLCLVLLVGGVLCLTWGRNVPEQSDVRHAETSAPPPKTVAEADAVDDTEPDTPEPLEIPQTEGPTEQTEETTQQKTENTTSAKKENATQGKTPSVEEPVPAETEPSAEEKVPAETTPDREENVPAETEPPAEENKAFQAWGQVNAENNMVMEDTSFGDNGVSAQIPAGTLLEENTTELVLTIMEKDSSDSGVALEAGQAMRPLDVHIQGVSQNNTQPIQVCLGKVLPNGMNIGNVMLYHVENGTANPMTQVLTMSELDAHNEFYYDPVTGDTTVSMASFSEVALVADTESGWEGEYDYTWYDATATELTIANADQLAAFSRIVGGMAEGIDRDNFAGKIVKLTADINLADPESDNDTEIIFYPIGYYYIADQNDDGTTDDPYSTVCSFKGTFDGQGHTVANFYQNTWEMKGDDPYYNVSQNHYYNDAMGLFGYVVDGKITNLTVDNFSSDGEFTPTGVIAAYAVNATFENIAITNCNPRVYNTGNGGIVGIGGSSTDTEDSKLTFTNITIDNTNKISALWGSWDVACGGLVGMFRGTGHVYMTNCHVAAQIDVYNDVCGNYQYYWYRYSGMLVGTNKNMTTDENGYTVPETSKFHAENCTVHFGEWNDYYYCELVANSLASYTHDHQFSRLTQISSLDEINSGDTWTKTGNFLLIDGDTKTCYHIVKAEDGALKQHLHTDSGTEEVNGETVDKEDKTIVYLPFNQLFTGYGWGVKHIPVYNGEDYAFDGVTILDREVADSQVKFVSKFTGEFLYRVGNVNTVSIGSLFAENSENEANKVTINKSGVYVTIDKVDDTTNVSGTYTPSTTESWQDGTIRFSGTGPVKVTIQDYDYCEPTVLYLEVVDATNVTDYSGLGNKNSVLLNDITMSSGSSYYLSDATLYGNGFTFDVTDGAYDGTGTLTNNYLIYLSNATLDNTKVVGKVYTTYSGMAGNDYNRACVYVSGDSVIANSYISNCAAPVRVGTDAGTKLLLKNTTLKGGSLCNLDMRGGDITIDGLTTINQVNANDAADDGTVIIGLGVLVYYEGPSGTETITITGDGLTQYNYISSEQKGNTVGIAQNVYAEVFKIDSEYIRTVESVEWVNTGILSLMPSVEITGCPDAYGTTSVSYMNQDGTLYTVKAASYPATLPVSVPTYAATAQYSITPVTSFEYPTAEGKKNYLAKSDDSADFCYYDSTTAAIQIGFEKGSSFTFDPDILSIKKCGKTITPEITMEGVSYTGQSITFTEGGEYTITYTYTDPNNYRFDDSGNITSYEVTHTKTAKVKVTASDPAIDPATFDFNGNGAKTVAAGNYTYIMPDVSATSDTIASTTVSGETVYYPLVYVKYSTSMSSSSAANSSLQDTDSSTVLNKSAYSTAFCPVFNGVVTIVDNGTTYNGSTTTMADGKLEMISDWEKVLKWASANTVPTANPAVNNNVLYFQSVTIQGVERSQTTYVFEYVYTDTAGNVYHYYVGYIFPTKKAGCFAAGTQITLSDGTQKPIEEITYEDELLAWDLNTGMYTTTTPSLIEAHETCENRIINLRFADGTTVRIIDDHGFFNVEENNFVFIDEGNIDSYIGHDFVKVGENGTYTTTQLLGYEITTENVSYYTIQTAIYNNCIAENMFTLTTPHQGLKGWFDYFEIGEGMKYDEEKMQADIEQYGLYTYEDFADYVTYEQFIAFNGPYLKVLVGRGVVTYEQILELIEIYVAPLQ